MEKFQVKFVEADGEKRCFNLSRTSADEIRQDLAKNFPDAKDIDIRKLAGVWDEKIRDHIDRIKIDVRDDEYLARVKERLRCCADAAYMFGTESQESLERTLGRMAGNDSYRITGLDGHMFSFSFRLGTMYGGIIFHCSAKEWASHT